jgi:hypothetical protein
MKYIITTFAAICCATMLNAQITTTLPIDTAKQAQRGKTSLSIGSGGIRLSKDRPDKQTHLDEVTIGSEAKENSVDRGFEVQFGMLDLGINTLHDNTDYKTAAARNFLRVDDAYANAELFSLRTSKSVNVNVYPIMVKARLYKSARQKITLATGIGLQLYNFRFTKPVSYRADPTSGVVLDSISFSKNKLAFNYLTVPLMINAKTKIAGGGMGKDNSGYWLTYGVGISGGYLLSSWTKQVSDERGKDKNHDPFNFRKTNLCVNGELGLDGYLRLYASYQLTSLHETALDQHPFSIGLRFLGL